MDMSIDDFYRGTCVFCGIFVDSSYCEKVEDGYNCYGCGKTHKVSFAKKYFMRLVHTSGKIKTGRVTITTSISDFIKLLGSHGWLASEYNEMQIDPETGRFFELKKVKLGGVDAG